MAWMTTEDWVYCLSRVFVLLVICDLSSLKKLVVHYVSPLGLF